MELKSALGAIVVFGSLVGVYITLYKLNKKTPLPPGCEDLKADCEGCHDYACTNNPHHER
ncbi:hypothetical protein [Dubosiella newyorkensis]|jgi:hypothetical protein|uniref:Uncharacterized protein n=1 Tax=Dubosiella newyorkensis TaxID=1862672 RepID=A0A1U7NJS2_9FIRM|nr:hypothetical protein [Dubosiella newyorkensis]MCI9041688.1 hypothetical protein [Dubosiella newyorkensis]OLU44016.1 hypothetical protein BO225_11205 [Dubosiella newyorkensis]